MADAVADFNVKTLQTIAADFADVADLQETVVILADRDDFDRPFAFQCHIPPVGHTLRSNGLELLFARAATIAVAIVGTSHLRLICQDDSTLVFLRQIFFDNDALIRNMKEFGDVKIDRADADDTPICQLPFRSRSSAQPSELHSEPLNDQIYVGIDYGRSDIKAVVVDAKENLLAKYVTRWWTSSDAGVEYLDPQVLKSHREHIRCLAQAAGAALGQVTDLSKKSICGVGMSAAGCVKYGKLCGIPPAMGGVEDAPETRKDLERLEKCVVEEMKRNFKVSDHCTTVLVNDGDASALYGASGMPAGKAGLFLSCGTGLAGGVVWKGQSCDGILELGKLVMGLRQSADGVVPLHDGLNLEAAAQGMAGTQRAFFNLLAARGGDVITGKAEQRAALVAMQKGSIDEKCRGLFESLGQWLARFVHELNEYLPVKVEYVEAGGKVTDGPTGEIMMEACRNALPGIEVRKALDSEFGQAVAVANLVRPQ